MKEPTQPLNAKVLQTDMIRLRHSIECSVTDGMEFSGAFASCSLFLI
jgi:hypothetical protein